MRKALNATTEARITATAASPAAANVTGMSAKRVPTVARAIDQRNSICV
jgi:hypothetical protein